MSVSVAPSPLPPLRRQRRWLIATLWVVLTIALVAAVRAVPWRGMVGQLGHVRPGWVVLAVAAYAATLPVWAAEWRLLAPGSARSPFRRMLDVVSVMASVLNSVPFFAGEASGAAMLIARAGLSRGAAVSVLAMDQLLSGLAKLVVLTTAALLVPLPSWLRAGVLALVAGVAALLTVCVALAHRWGALRERLLSKPDRVRAGVARVVSIGRHLDAIRETHRAWRLAALAISKKALELLGIVAVQVAFGLEPSLAAAMLMLAALAIASLAPVAPGNVGVYEAAVFAAYRYLGVRPDLALGMAVVQHACFLLPMLATGYVTLTLRQLRPTADVR